MTVSFLVNMSWSIIQCVLRLKSYGVRKLNVENRFQNIKRLTINNCLKLFDNLCQICNN